VDQKLQHAWHTEARPFDGKTLHLADLVPLDRLSLLLSAAVTALRRAYENASLLSLADWHEHDGYITSAHPITWQELEAIASSVATLYERRPGDDFVRLGFYEASGTFFLRVWVLDEDDDRDNYPGKWGNFDLSASEALLQVVASSVPSESFLFSPALKYFNERFAG
jgi:hypothetical protein